MRIPKKADLRNYALSVQKGLQEVPERIEDLKKGIHQGAVELGKAVAWLADKAEYCNATDVICKKLDIERDVQKFIVIPNRFESDRTREKTGKFVYDGVIMPLPQELEEDAFSEVIIECLTANATRSMQPKIINSRLSGLQKHLKQLKFEGEYRLADSWEDAFVKLDENWARHNAYWGIELDPREQTVSSHRRLENLPSKLYVVACLKEIVNRIESEKMRNLRIYGYNVGDVASISKKERNKIINEKVVWLDQQANKYGHLLKYAQKAEETLESIRKTSLVKNAKNFDRVAERYMEKEALVKATEASNEAYERAQNAYDSWQAAVEEGPVRLAKKERDLKKQQEKELEEFKKQQEKEREEQLKTYEDKINAKILKPREARYKDAVQKREDASQKYHEESKKFYDKGKDLL